MRHQALQTFYQTCSAEDQAGQRSLETLLNCYCREVAGPAGQIGIGPLFGQGDWPMALRAALGQGGGKAMHILLPHSEERLLVAVDQASATGNYRYRSPFYHKSPGRPWAPLDWRTLATLLLRDLASQNDVPFNQELLEQIRDSVAVTGAILAAPQPAVPQKALAAYLDSEQSLAFGHPFHPAPKSRQGFSAADLQRYAPELRASFPLHYFAVRREHWLQQSLLPESADALLAAQAPAGLEADDDFALLPAHPWQARYLLSRPAVQSALEQDRLRDLGPQGPAYFATSSIRTLFHPDNPYFYKCSLHVRITNCVRKNAIYELDGALQVTRIMRTVGPRLIAQFPNLRILEEPAYASIRLGSNETPAEREAAEGFGLILRQGLAPADTAATTPLLAGSLFGNHTRGQARLADIIGRLARRQARPWETVAEDWFSAYVEQLLPPVLHCFFDHGIVFEPHLQNVLIGLTRDWPSHVWLRDFEGVKLVAGRFNAVPLDGVDARVRQALFYSEDQGWNRIAYCLLVNNFCEAVAQLSALRPSLEPRLWRIVGHQLRCYLAQHGNPNAARRINALLAGTPFPAKANLINRFYKRPDRDSTYIPLPSPLAYLGDA
ncbi:siderophore synthetase component [Methylobacter tundripaludum]|uniref:Siderophore synthetase component n=2 Tax=Methylobacter tundripaludum TaxID=173365 RepID=A0A2S6HEX1_9GAMM|nr:siderophore synthetase component [Methylobacter tundripaludum]